MKKFKLNDARKFAKLAKLNFKKELFTLKDLLEGMNEELEHKRITGGDPIMSGMIALDHLEKIPDYYKRLKKLEKEAMKYWYGK
jgi:hypothetical protein